MAQTRKYYLKKQFLDLEVKGQGFMKVIMVPTHRHMIMHPYTKYHWHISKDKNVMARTRKYYLKNNYLTLKSKVKDSRRSLLYEKHRLMTMHPHTKYHWPILKDKNVKAQTRKYYLKNQLLDLEVKGQGSTTVIMVRDKPPYDHARTYQISLT